ncbi:MAG: class I SAM-dependent RNA methyltransferase [Kiritimatiellia bacterium]
MRNLWTSPTPLAVTCGRGIAPYLKQELEAMGYEILGVKDTMVGIQATNACRDIFRLNLHLRTAQRVLWPFVQSSNCRDLMDLYHLGVDAPWEQILDPDKPFFITNATKNETIFDSRMPTLKLKDAIVDRIRERCSRRPNISREDDAAAVFLHWEGEHAKIYIDTTGNTLSRRGYRKEGWLAPMQESLAAACIMASGWDCKRPFIVPFCGSGTPAIEAALMARHIAPGKFHNAFAFMQLKGWTNIIPGETAGESVRKRFGAAPQEIWKNMVVQARAAELPADDPSLPLILGVDVADGAVVISIKNAETAGVDKNIKFFAEDFTDTPLPQQTGIIFMNPPYGERLEDDVTLEPLYEEIGTWLKNTVPAGWMAWVITASKALSLKINLQTCAIHPFMNGPLDCRLLGYEVRECALMEAPAEESVLPETEAESALTTASETVAESIPVEETTSEAEEANV